jgi:hypothetical protein
MDSNGYSRENYANSSLSLRFHVYLNELYGALSLKTNRDAAFDRNLSGLFSYIRWTMFTLVCTIALLVASHCISREKLFSLRGRFENFVRHRYPSPSQPPNDDSESGPNQESEPARIKPEPPFKSNIFSASGVERCYEFQFNANQENWYSESADLIPFI